jgi:hypothetical protein
MALTKKSLDAEVEVGGEAPVSPPRKEATVANVKVRILYPSAFEARGIETWKKEEVKRADGRVFVRDVEQLDEVSIDPKVADELVAGGFAEKV